MSASLTYLDVALLSLVEGAVQLASFQFFFTGNDSYVAVDSVCLWEEVSSGSSYATILDHLLSFYFILNVLLWIHKVRGT